MDPEMNCLVIRLRSKTRVRIIKKSKVREGGGATEGREIAADIVLRYNSD